MEAECVIGSEKKLAFEDSVAPNHKECSGKGVRIEGSLAGSHQGLVIRKVSEL